MNNKELSPPVMVAVIVAVVILIGLIGWHYMSGGQRGPNGEDLSKPAVLPANMHAPAPSQGQGH